ncbi:MAG: DNA polymerase IV [bacterium]
MTDKQERKILLVDMNAYFASVEQQCNPELRGKPIVVCGEGRTIVTTASYEARRYGVKTGMNLYEAKRACPFVIPVIGNIEKYVSTSLQIHKILLEYTDRVEVFSIDECFVDLTEVERFWGGGEKIALRIKQSIKKQFGLTCSIGIAPNRVVAKIAGKYKKPDGLTILTTEEVPTFMAKLTVDQLQGVGLGHKIAQKLKYMGINTAKQLGEADGDMLKARFGVMGRFYKNVGLGIDHTPVKFYNDSPPVKSVGHSHTLPEDTYDVTVVKAFLLMLSEKTAARLREYKLTGRTVYLIVRFDDFEMFSGRETLKHYFNTGVELYELAWKIFQRLMPLKKAVRLLGVSITNLSSGLERQEYLFEDMQKKQKLTEVMDNINNKYGAFTIKASAIKIAEKHGILERCGIIGTSLIKE